jgi:hypothetical protein
MKLRYSLYAQPEIIRGQQCAEAPLDRGGATKQLPARRYLVLEGGRTAEPAWAVERRRRRPQEHGWASQRAVARRGGRGPDAGRAFVTCPGPWPASGVRCPVRATSVHGCLSMGPMSSVRCGRLSVQVSGVRCRRPVSGVGVRCLCVAACAVSGPSEVLERGGGAGSRMAGMAGVGVVARCVHARLVVCLSRSLVLDAGAGGAGPAEASVWTWPSSWEVVGQWPARPGGRPG